MASSGHSAELVRPADAQRWPLQFSCLLTAKPSGSVLFQDERSKRRSSPPSRSRLFRQRTARASSRLSLRRRLTDLMLERPIEYRLVGAVTYSSAFRVSSPRV